MRRNIFICLALAGITLAIYWPARNFDLYRSDDPLFLTENPEIRSGLNGHSVIWAMTGVVATNWHPVTSLSFVLGHQFWGTNPGAEHMVNVVIHAFNAALLFLVLQRMMGLRSNKSIGATTPQVGLRRDDPQQPYDSPPRNANKTANAAIAATAPQAGTTWRSAVVAALFAWHPLRVESVAWISERKDVLSVFFFFLTLLAYARYAQGRSRVEPSSLRFAAPESRGSSAGSGSLALDPRRWTLDYCMALVFFALGLMSKAMLVTVPFVLLLLDVWPLGRVTSGGWQVAGGKKTGVQPGKRVRRLRGFPVAIGKRLLLEKWPFLVLAAAVSVITFMVQHGEAATTSLKVLGPGIRLENVIVSYLRYLAWTIWPTNLAAYYSFPFDSHFHLALWPDWEIGAGALLLACVSALCLVQIVRRPYLAIGWFWYLGTMAPVIGLVQVGRQGMADRYTYIPLIGPVISLVWLISEKWASGIFSRTLLVIVTTAVLAASILQTHHQLQFWKNTETLSQHTMETTGESAQAEYRMGLALEQKGDIPQAIIHYNNAMTMQPTVKEAFWAMGQLFSQQGKWTDTEKIYSVLLRIKRDDFTSHLGLATTLPHLGRTDEAVTQLKAALRTCPDTPGAMNNLAWTLATSGEAGLRDGARAAKYAEHACELTHYRETIMVGTLAAAYAEAGRFDEAISTAQKACALASKSGEQELLQKNQELLELYRAHQPYHEPTEKLVPAAP